ncbi:MAG: DNA mismatch repair endonuclease MutL [Clostridia bacterium]|nr:DNA mismatch repair endonuclease MutL [Clostridia bacterium]
MPKINILPAKVYNRIAAGEVVDRPYSVVKELVENSIDAGATEIEIYIEQGGKQLIRVVDNGCGIEREDLHSAFLPHATSKIAQAEDLENIVTLGFRGEAVASIAAVSKMTITSKTKEGKCYSLHSDGGELGQITEAAGEKGTDVCVEMLFFNTPVRLGFLKSDKAEETDITHFVSRFILNRPEIAFTYYVNGKKQLQSFGGGVEEALVGVYGASTLAQCYQIDADKHGIRIRGYIGNQNFFKPNKSYQSVFLNGRYIQNATVSSALSNAYTSYMMKRQYPFYVLYIDVPTEIVDVNVHPNKADVRFADNKIIYGCIYSVISAVLDGQTKALDYVVRQPSSTVYADDAVKTAEQVVVEVQEKPQEKLGYVSMFDKPKKSTSDTDAKRQTVFGITTLTYEEAQREMEVSAPAFTAKKQGIELPFEDTEKAAQQPAKGFIPMEDIPDYEPTGEVYKPRKNSKKTVEDLHKRFPDLYFKRNVLQVDDPAFAHVQENVEALDSFAENKRLLEELDKKNKQNRIDVSSCVYVGKMFNTYLIYECKDDIYIIDQHAAHERLIFNRLKQQMANRQVVQQPMLIPYELSLNVFEREFIREHISEIREMGFDLEENGENFAVHAIPLDLQHIDLKAFFGDILNDIDGYRAIRLTDILKDKLASAACKAAVKGGMDLTREEIDALFALMDGDMGLKCPHGRPVVVKMPRTELEKMFKRIV